MDFSTQMSSSVANVTIVSAHKNIAKLARDSICLFVFFTHEKFEMFPIIMALTKVWPF